MQNHPSCLLFAHRMSLSSVKLTETLVSVLVLYESFLPSSGYVELLQDRLEKTNVSLRESPCLTGAPTPWAADLK